MKIHSKKAFVLFALLAALSVGPGCGKNAHVTAKDAQKSGGGLEPEERQVQPTPPAEPAALEGMPGEGPRDGRQQGPSRPGSEPETVREVEPEPAPVVVVVPPPAPVVVVVPAPAPAPVAAPAPAPAPATGSAPADDARPCPASPAGPESSCSDTTSVIVSIEGDQKCGLHPEKIESIVSAIDADQIERLRKENGSSLPYILNGKKALKKKFVYTGPRKKAPEVEIVTLDQTTPGEKFVLNGQVIFKVSMTLPPRHLIDVSQPLQAVLNLNLFKHWVDNYPDTEIVCLLEAGLCSGRAFYTDYWSQFVNRAFGNGSKPLKNRYFSNQIGKSIQKSSYRVGGRKEWRGLVSFDIAKLFAPQGTRLSNFEVLELLYGNADPYQVVERTFHLVVADDVMVMSEGTGLEMSFVRDSCREGN